MSPRAIDDHEERLSTRREEGSTRSGVSQYRAPEAESILRRVIEIIESSPGMPMSASVRVNKDEVLEMLNEAVSRLPDELRSARWLLKEREEFLAKKQREGEELIADAKVRVARLADRQEVVRAAHERAEQIVDEAEVYGRRIRREAEDYCDQRLASFENVLAKVQKSVAVGRKRLAAPTIEEAELGGSARREPRGGRSSAQRSGKPVFDQDQ